MDAKRLWYWVTTAWVVGIMTITGGLSVAHAKTMMEGSLISAIPPILQIFSASPSCWGPVRSWCRGFARIFARTREWAYAGFAIVIVSASYSHLFSGDGLKSLEPLATLAALAVSYWTRPADRSLNFYSARFDAAMPPEAAR